MAVVHMCDGPDCKARARYTVVYDPGQEPQDCCLTHVGFLADFAISGNGGILMVKPIGGRHAAR